MLFCNRKAYINNPRLEIKVYSSDLPVISLSRRNSFNPLRDMLVISAEAPSVRWVVPARALRILGGGSQLLAEKLPNLVLHLAERSLDAHAHGHAVLQVARL